MSIPSKKEKELRAKIVNNLLLVNYPERKLKKIWKIVKWKWQR